ncbi:MAG: RnfABCDGE type electron transport complex subunit D [Dysgonamonadaceae bacterium]|jgi:electron transport complex protein RnfD|nr:RnfABCDGE type electron transport complex subunit D [Dysgonamonadaceae bacterium]
MQRKINISPSPHIHSGDTIRRNMLDVLIALVPATLVGLYFFGLGALIVGSVSIISCITFEYLIQRFLLKKTNSIGDLSALVTGVLLAFNLPSNLPVWMVIIGALVAIGVGKMSFGGLGNNPFNPALVGRVFLLISFPVQMTTWPEPAALSMHYLDAETAATPLSMIKNHFGELPHTIDLLLGNVGGSMGEVSSIALLLGGIYLLVRKVITWHIPVSILATVFVFTGIMHWGVNSAIYATPLLHILAGGLLLGSFFMATDYATSPMTAKGMYIYGAGIGIITVVIRIWGAYPEGISFAILIMNAFVPLINFYVKPKRFG